MSKAFQQPFEIDVILDNCPSLVELSFSGGTKAPSHQDMTTIDLSKDHRLWSHTTTNTTLKLQTLCIKGLILSPSLLKVLVGASPHLIKLQLSRIGLGSDPVQPFNSPFILERFPDDLMSLTAQSCPRLEYIQMGLSAIIMNEYELLNFRDSFKAVSHWGFNRSDLQQRSLSKFLLNNINLPIYLTGLEIHPDAAPAGIHMDLHTYLTSPYAGTLIHLRILGANYSLSHFESGFLSPDIAWTCSGLETLHLRAHSEYGNLTAEDSHKAGNQWLSRHVFLGLSKAFPKMKDLWINSPNIDFELEGGMCLLRRMVDLEKIRIQSMRGGLFKERDLAWLNSDPTPTQHARNNHILKEVQDQIRTFRGGSHNRLDMVHPKMVPGYKPRLRDQSIAGTLEQVADLLEEIQTPGVAKRSLPYLESLVIESGKRLSEFIQKEQETQAKKIIKRMHGTFLFKLKYNYIDN
ncbi:hypothetical protein FBU30_001825 [Linnemannia zychae]|nr:hypothetical protein FBU30_001825 [Linnemannia zychae]